MAHGLEQYAIKCTITVQLEWRVAHGGANRRTLT